MASNADAFRAMADRIDKNAAVDFAGAFCMVSPEGNVHQVLLLNPESNTGMFLGTVKALLEVAARELAEGER